MEGTATVHTSIGRRDYQEDRFFYEKFDLGYLMAIFDGHGGKEVAEVASKNLLNFFSQEHDNLKTKGQVDYKILLKSVTSRLSRSVEEYSSGSTMSLVFISRSEENAAYVAVLGDSPIVISNLDGNLFIGPEHNVRSNLIERKLAKKRGGFYSGGYIWNEETGSGLQMSRALGDVDKFGHILSRQPEIMRVDIGKDSIILVGSDGLFDPKHTTNSREEAKRFIAMIRGGAEAKDLVDDALARETGDNVTAIVFRFNSK